MQAAVRQQTRRLGHQPLQISRARGVKIDHIVVFGRVLARLHLGEDFTPEMIDDEACPSLSPCTELWGRTTFRVVDLDRVKRG